MVLLGSIIGFRRILNEIFLDPSPIDAQSIPNRYPTIIISLPLRSGSVSAKGNQSRVVIRLFVGVFLEIVLDVMEIVL